MQITQVAASAGFNPTPDAHAGTTPTPASALAAPPPPPPCDGLAMGANFIEAAAICRGDTGGSTITAAAGTAAVTAAAGTSAEAQLEGAIVTEEEDEVSKAGAGVTVAVVAVAPEATAAAAWRRSNVTAATNTTRQRASSKLLKRFPLH